MRKRKKERKKKIEIFIFVFLSFCIGCQNSWDIFDNRIAKAFSLKVFVSLCCGTVSILAAILNLAHP